MSDNRRNDATTGGAEFAAADHEGFLTRWSRRKATARDGDDAPERMPEKDLEQKTAVLAEDAPVAPPTGAADGGAQQSSGATETTTELPPIESLDENSDYSAFLASDVSADLQKKALRKLFHSPKFNVRDGLDDYDLDFSNPEPLGDIITAEMRHRMLREVQRLAGLDADEDDAEGVSAAAPVEVDASTDADKQVETDTDPDTDDEQSKPS